VSDGGIIAIVVCLVVVFGMYDCGKRTANISTHLSIYSPVVVFSFLFMLITDRCGCRLTCFGRRAQIGLLKDDGLYVLWFPLG
jgi:hypothetical protein